MEEVPLYCNFHPATETRLRCNKCSTPICPKCAMHTPTGYRCRNCIKGQRKSFDTAKWFDSPIVFTLSFIIALIGSLIAQYLGFFVIFIAPVVGYIIAEVSRNAIQKRRSRNLGYFLMAGSVIGSTILLALYVIQILRYYQFTGLNFSILLPIIFRTLFCVIVTSTAYYRFRGIRINR